MFQQNVLSEVHGEDLVSSACYSEVQRIHLEELSIVFKKFDFNQTKNQMMTIDSYREHVSDFCIKLSVYYVFKLFYKIIYYE